jgi:hypothetical protein
MDNFIDLIGRRRAEYLQAASMFCALAHHQRRVGDSRLLARHYIAGRIANSLLCPRCVGDSQMAKTETTMRWGERLGWVLLGMWIELTVLGLCGLLF